MGVNGGSHIIEWQQLTFQEIGALDRELPVVLPLGVLEAHGPQLPVSTDLSAAEYICRRVAERTDCILLPPVNYGFVGYSRSYTGTLGVSVDTMASALEDLMGLLDEHGFRKIVLISGHGANILPYQVAAFRLSLSHPRLRTRYVNWWIEAGYTVHHSDAFETETAAAMGLVAHMDRAEPHKVPDVWYFEVSRHALAPETGGVNGNPTEADVARGQAELDHSVDVLVRLVERARNDPSSAGVERS